MALDDTLNSLSFIFFVFSRFELIIAELIHKISVYLYTSSNARSNELYFYADVTNPGTSVICISSTSFSLTTSDELKFSGFTQA